MACDSPCIDSFEIEDGAVDTTDIANGAVTSTEIEDGAVDTPDIADGAVTTEKIEDRAVGTAELADDAVTSGKIDDGAVGTDDLADRAVTPEKLAFEPTPVARVVYVSGDDTPTNNGLALLDAFAAIGTSGPCSSPGPSSSAPCLVKLGPGIYDVGTTALSMREHVDVEGSGRLGTRVQGNGEWIVLLENVSHIEIRDLTVAYVAGREDRFPWVFVVRSLFGGDNVRFTRITSLAIATDRGDAVSFAMFQAPATLTDVVAIAESSLGRGAGVVASETPDLVIERSHLTGDNTALALADLTSATVSDSMLRGRGFSSVRIGNSLLDAASARISASQIVGDLYVNSDSSLSIATSQIGRVSSVSSGALVCVHTYDANFQPRGC